MICIGGLRGWAMHIMISVSGGRILLTTIIASSNAVISDETLSFCMFSTYLFASTMGLPFVKPLGQVSGYPQNKNRLAST
ncbi:MAG: hypothetical protein J1E43_03150 [Christensenellaceae bacterium]|nr:hypothetical protein [Christensenellaceae bacterium]